MFDVGAFELLLLFLVALLVLGPERLPPLARTLGGWTRKAKRMASGLREEFARELATEDWKKEIDRQKAQLRELESKLKEDIGDPEKSPRNED